jgi:DNA polymerase delta subunit 2
VYVPKVLDVQAGKLCYIIGTVYMDMPLKPNILEDITKEVSVGGLRTGMLAVAG